VVDVRNENRPEILKQIVQLQEHEIHRLQSRIRVQAERIAQLSGNPGEVQLELVKLQELLARREQALFGVSSERRKIVQAPDNKPRGPQKGHGPKAQPALPVVEALWELDDADKVCTACGGALAAWDGQFEESEEIDVVERQFVMRKHKRQKYRCPCGGCVETALGPQKLRPNNRYSIDFAIEVAAQKYLDHMPLERQVRAMRREGLEVDSQTLWTNSRR
jgi:transposase